MMGTHAGLTLRLFGAAQITGAGGERASELLAKPKTLALLTYLALALPRGLHRRDALLALLWPDSDSNHARNSLRQGLHMLRSHLPAGTLTSRGNAEVGLDACDLDVDVTTFEKLLDEGRVAEALALYTGALLDGFSLFANTAFDAWLSGERERLQHRAVRAAMVLADQSERQGENALAAEWARFALERSPYDEDLLRDVIELFLRRGDRAGATQLYNSAADRFRADLGVTMSLATARLGRSLAEERSIVITRPMPGAGGRIRTISSRAHGHAERVHSTASRHLRCAAPLPRSTAVRWTEIAGRRSSTPSSLRAGARCQPRLRRGARGTRRRAVPGGHLHRLPGQRRRMAPCARSRDPGNQARSAAR